MGTFLVERGLLAAEAAGNAQLGFVGKVRDDAAVGLEPPQDVGLHKAAQRAEVGGLALLDGADAAGEIGPAAEQAGIEKIEERPEIAGPVFDRGAAHGDARRCLELLDGLCLSGPGIFDCLSLVEDDEAPWIRGEPVEARDLRVGGEDDVGPLHPLERTGAAAPCPVGRIRGVRGDDLEERGEADDFLPPVAQQRGGGND